MCVSYWDAGLVPLVAMIQKQGLLSSLFVQFARCLYAADDGALVGLKISFFADSLAGAIQGWKFLGRLTESTCDDDDVTPAT